MRRNGDGKTRRTAGHNAGGAGLVGWGWAGWLARWLAACLPAWFGWSGAGDWWLGAGLAGVLGLGWLVGAGWLGLVGWLAGAG